MSAQFRIALAGAEATGKTALAQLLAGRLDIPILEDPRPALLSESRCHTLFEAAQYRPVWRELLELQVRREAAAEAAILDTCAGRGGGQAEGGRQGGGCGLRHGIFHPADGAGLSQQQLCRL